MIKKLMLVAVALTIAATSFAQGSRRQEISLAYGVAPVTDWVDSYSNLLTGAVLGSDTELTGWGAATLGYSFRVIGGLRVGAQVVYSSNTQQVVYLSSTQKVKGVGPDISNSYWSVMPNVKWNWLNLKIISLYARVGAGLTFAKSEYGDRNESATRWAYQVSPIGIEVGTRIAAFAEAGIGTSGSLIVGARYRF